MNIQDLLVGDYVVYGHGRSGRIAKLDMERDLILIYGEGTRRWVQAAEITGKQQNANIHS